MNDFIVKFAQSKLMKKLEAISLKLSSSPTFSTISQGMGGTMGLILIGAMVQIFLALASNLFGLETTSLLYTTIYAINQMTMGLIGLFMAFNLAYTYAQKFKMNGVQAGFVSMICFILVCTPITYVTADGNTYFHAISIDALGATAMFTGIFISLISVRISKFAIDHHWTIKMPDVVPDGILNSFNSIIPASLNILFWYGLASILSISTQGALTIPNLIMYLLSIPLKVFTSVPGMIVLIIIAQLCWFFGIHGSAVVYQVIMIPMVAAYMTNAELAGQGLPLVFSAVFLFGANAALGGAGNTLPLVIMGLKSKSKTLKAVSKAALPAAIFNINEPVIFGFPIMYNPLMLIPFILCPVVCAILYYIVYSLGLISYPQVLIMTILPVGLGPWMSTLDWKNVVFVALLFPVCWLIYYPFFKMYEKQMIEQENAEANQ